MKKSETLLSVVLIINKRDIFKKKEIDKIFSYLIRKYSNFEVILVDNKCTEETREEIKQLLESQNNLKTLTFSKPCLPNVAVKVGLSRAIGDFALILNYSLETENYEFIDSIVEASKKEKLAIQLVREGKKINFLTPTVLPRQTYNLFTYQHPEQIYLHKFLEISGVKKKRFDGEVLVDQDQTISGRFIKLIPKLSVFSLYKFLGLGLFFLFFISAFLTAHLTYNHSYLQEEEVFFLVLDIFLLLAAAIHILLTRKYIIYPKQNYFIFEEDGRNNFKFNSLVETKDK